MFMFKKFVWPFYICHTFIYLVDSIINEYKVPSAVEHNKIIKQSFTNAIEKPLECWHRLNVQYGNYSPSSSQVYKWCKSFKNSQDDNKTKWFRMEWSIKCEKTPLNQNC